MSEATRKRQGPSRRAFLAAMGVGGGGNGRRCVRRAGPPPPRGPASRSPG